MKRAVQKIQSDRRGYTIVEMLVTVAIFALSFVTIAAIFVGFSTAQTRAGVSQRLLNEGNYLLEVLAREIRMNAIDYDCSAANPATSHDYICLRSVDGESIHFRLFDDVANPSTTVDLQVCKDFSASPCALSSDWTTLNPDFLKINELSFQTHPIQNPLRQDVPDEQLYQPVTTILMTVEAGRGRAVQTYELQTSVASRVYYF